jgi:hypothetical protein
VINSETFLIENRTVLMFKESYQTFIHFRREYLLIAKLTYDECSCRR